ncbi:type II toxin-antitoxin system CcdA family antitoxin [Roseomonas marmotae]|uniref:Type II toxin-antitoxin system CcdA family antitoxin n=1 Tax=Roseomonas marmotae TaxID=2768161 RepID=A0ABS3KHW2_9PROT|nr:type II toxin-antitoxin system CcdA family antitoxin [Roseomonas marmotae]MBO1077063.1 type II toxin-antitoxin system CcdA family antitoxin [Roseomonas marmotae]QTI81882.1 type II toxin-antitoxin system CcdA family antitoxin [Roseomonas marmotae]
MPYDANAPKRRVNMTLNVDLVDQARVLTDNLSDTVEHLLAQFVAEAGAAQREKERRIDQHIEASNLFVARHGTLADEFSTL